MRIPRLIISGLSGGAGKTMLSLGLARAFARQGLPVRAFKKGPDYIDAAWLAAASKSPQSTLDPFFTPGDQLAALFVQEASGCALALVEGNRGLFDGLDINGSCSTAEVSRILRAPVLLVLDCTKMTRTVAAVVRGCLDFEEGLAIGGVILNRTGNKRHHDLARRAVEELAGVPVLGVLPRRAEPFIVERHMGLAGPGELAAAESRLDALADFIAEHTDLQRILALAQSAPALHPGGARGRPQGKRDEAPKKSEPIRSLPLPQQEQKHGEATDDADSGAFHGSCVRRPRIGYVFDAAFWFYYRENLEALEAAGARIVPVSLLERAEWPDLDGLYIGGGLPELHAQALSANLSARQRVAEFVRGGLPVYAECGGFMYLSRSLIYRGERYPMAGVFPLDVDFCRRPQGLGYVEAQVVADSPYHPAGCFFRGHEFHFSRPVNEEEGLADRCLLRLRRGKGMFRNGEGEQRDGLLKNACFAAYTHLFAPAAPHWAPAFVGLCRRRP